MVYVSSSSIFGLRFIKHPLGRPVFRFRPSCFCDQKPYLPSKQTLWKLSDTQTPSICIHLAVLLLQLLPTSLLRLRPAEVPNCGGKAARSGSFRLLGNLSLWSSSSTAQFETLSISRALYFFIFCASTWSKYIIFRFTFCSFEFLDCTCIQAKRYMSKDWYKG